MQSIWILFTTKYELWKLFHLILYNSTVITAYVCIKYIPVARSNGLISIVNQNTEKLWLKSHSKWTLMKIWWLSRLIGLTSHTFSISNLWCIDLENTYHSILPHKFMRVSLLEHFISQMAILRLSVALYVIYWFHELVFKLFKIIYIKETLLE